MKINKNWKDVVQRAWRTFWQAGLSYLFLNIQIIVEAIQTDLEIGGFETIKQVGMTVGMGALAAALSALYNGVIAPVIKPAYVEPEEDDDEIGLDPVVPDDIVPELPEETIIEDEAVVEDIAEEAPIEEQEEIQTHSDGADE